MGLSSRLNQRRFRRGPLASSTGHDWLRALAGCCPSPVIGKAVFARFVGGATSNGLHAEAIVHMLTRSDTLADIPQIGFGPSHLASIRFFWQGGVIVLGERRSALHLSGRSLIFPSLRRSSPLVFTRTHDNRTPYAGAGSGGGRSSAISRRMSANKCREMATSAIWKAM